MLVLHKLRAVRSFDSVTSSEKPNNILRTVLSEMNCCNVVGHWTPYGDSYSEKDKAEASKIHGMVVELLKDLSAPQAQCRGNGPTGRDRLNRNDEKKMNALRTLHELTASTLKDNRVPMVCTTKYDILAALTSCLEQAISCEQSTDMRRSICLILNNLSIPFDNKAVMVLGPSSRPLLLSLLNVIEFNLPEAYLSCICLMNLSKLHDAKDIIFHLTQNEKIQKNHTHNDLDAYKCRTSIHTTIADDPMSLIRALENLIKSNSPFLVSNVHSVEGEAVRWSIGLLRNFTHSQHYCSILCKTSIPILLVDALKNSPRKVLEWTTDSLEELSLICLCELVRWTVGRDYLRNPNTIATFDMIANYGGIHGYRASIISATLAMRDSF